jgi:uncharacterized DUF497 family protein
MEWMEDDLAFDWDQANIEHIRGHAVTLGEVLQVFANEASDLRYEVVNSEERWTSIGHTDALRILVVVWTMRGESVRTVTAFDAGKRMVAEYVKQRGW